MKSINKTGASSLVNRLDDVQMSQPAREMAKAYVGMTEGALDVVWLAAAKIRAAVRGA
jgi:hypothetical protein